MIWTPQSHNTLNCIVPKFERWEQQLVNGRIIGSAPSLYIRTDDITMKLQSIEEENKQAISPSCSHSLDYYFYHTLAPPKKRKNENGRREEHFFQWIEIVSRRESAPVRVCWPSTHGFPLSPYRLLFFLHMCRINEGCKLLKSISPLHTLYTHTRENMARLAAVCTS